jgi:hypothetical protein
MEALYYSRLVPAKYYLYVLGLYLLNLVVANAAATSNDREKINVDELVARVGGATTMVGPDPRPPEQPAGILNGIMELFQGGGKNGLRDIFGFVASVYLKLTWHDCNSSYYGKAAADRQDDLEPSEFLLDVVNDAKTLRNKVEDFSPCRGTPSRMSCPRPGDCRTSMKTRSGTSRRWWRRRWTSSG